MPDTYYTIDAADGRLTVSGDLDINARDELEAALLVQVAAGHDVEIDLAGVTFIDSEAMAALIEGYNAARAAGTRVRVLRAEGMVHQVLTVTGVLELFARD